MKKLLILTLSSTLLLTSCATFLNGKEQKVQINAIDKKSDIYVDGKKAATGRNAIVKLKRDVKVKQIKIATEGYKDMYYVHYQSKKSPLYIMSWIPFGILFMPPFMDSGYTSFDYSKIASSKEKPIEIPVKTETEKYLFVNSTAFDLKEKDLTVRYVKRKNYSNSKKYKELETNDDNIQFDNSIFTDALNEILVTYKYTDSTNSIFKSNQNSSFLKAVVKKIDVKRVGEYSSKTFMNFIESDIEIEWDFVDIYGQSLYKKNIKATSGQFSIDFFKETTFKNSLKDAMSTSFLTFINDKKVRELLKVSEIKEIKMPSLVVNNGKLVTNLQEGLNSTVTIKTKNGHGSGFAISNDGYIITNFHVIATEKESDLKVIDNTGKEYKVAVVRKNENYDLAVLKVEKVFDTHFKLSDTKNYAIGQDIYAIGTPKTIELGQSLTKGIISGERNKNNISYLQVDASINGGNSGGPLVNKDGNLIGVVNAKLSGIGVEGIGFAIPAEKIKEVLSIETK